MPNQQLINYIKRQLSQGYNINSIKLNLARTGYTPEQIESAMAVSGSKSTRHLAKMLLLVGGGAVVLAVLITSLILFFSGPDEIQPLQKVLSKDVGVEILLDKSNLVLGESLDFGVRVINLGSDSGFEVKVKNEIFDNSNLVKSSDDSFTLSTQETKNYEMELDLLEGNYQLKTTLEFGGKIKSDSVDFRVGKEVSTSGGEVEVEEFETLSGVVVGKIEDIKLVAENEPDRALNLCGTLASSLEKDTCWLQVGLKVNRVEFCSGIVDLDKKDSCYVNIAIALKNYNLCNQVSNQNLKGACLALGG